MRISYVIIIYISCQALIGIEWKKGFTKKISSNTSLKQKLRTPKYCANSFLFSNLFLDLLNNYNTSQRRGTFPRVWITIWKSTRSLCTHTFTSQIKQIITSKAPPTSEFFFYNSHPDKSEFIFYNILFSVISKFNVKLYSRNFILTPVRRLILLHKSLYQSTVNTICISEPLTGSL